MMIVVTGIRGGTWSFNVFYLLERNHVCFCWLEQVRDNKLFVVGGGGGCVSNSINGSNNANILLFNVDLLKFFSVFWVSLWMLNGRTICTVFFLIIFIITMNGFIISDIVMI